MRDEIVKYLGTVLNSTAKTISERIGADRFEVSKELNAMHADGLVEREKRGGGGNEYHYWLARADALPKVQNEPPPMPSVAAAKPEVQPKSSAIEQDRDRLQAELLDLRITASNRQDKIRVLEARCANLEASIKENSSSLADRHNALVADHDKVNTELRGVQAANAKLIEEVETLREQIRTTHRPIGASVAEALKPFLLPGQKIIWREPFRWHDEEGFMPNHYEGMSIEALADSFGYQIVVNCELAAIIQPTGNNNDASNDVGSAESAGA